MTAEPTAPVLALSGDVDMLTADGVAADGRRLLASAGQGASLVVDLAGVSFIDSAGLSALVQLRLDALDAGGRVVLRNIPDRVSKLLKLTGLTTVFPTE